MTFLLRAWIALATLIQYKPTREDFKYFIVMMNHCNPTRLEFQNVTPEKDGSYTAKTTVHHWQNGGRPFGSPEETP
jgi:hypothetical protein